MERAEDYMRASMGMPPREKKKKNGTFNDSQSYKESSFSQRHRRNPFGPDRYTDEPIIPREYAEDVEFVETKDYSTTETRQPKGKEETYHESQISDAEFTEIKKPRSK